MREREIHPLSTLSTLRHSAPFVCRSIKFSRELGTVIFIVEIVQSVDNIQHDVTAVAAWCHHIRLSPTTIATRCIKGYSELFELNDFKFHASA
jgi:hypothetical protein